MTKSEFVAAVAQAAGTEANDTRRVVDAVLDQIQTTLANGGDITFPGFGKFSTAARAGRVGRNPRTGDAMTIPATTYPRFTPGTGLRTAVKEAPAPAATQRASRTEAAETAPAAAVDTQPKPAKKAKAEQAAKGKKKGKKNGKGKKK